MNHNAVVARTSWWDPLPTTAFSPPYFISNGGNPSISASQVLSNEVTRIQYEGSLTFQGDVGRSYKGQWNYSPEFEDGVRIYRWAEVKRKMQEDRFQERYNVNEEYSSFYDETNDEDEEENLHQETGRGSFIEVIKSAFITLFLLQTFWVSFFSHLQ